MLPSESSSKKVKTAATIACFDKRLITLIDTYTDWFIGEISR